MVHKPFWFWENAVDSEFCRYVLAGVDWEREAAAGRVEPGAGKVDLAARKTDVVWRGALHPLGSLLQSFIRSANENAGWNFDLRAHEAVQVGRYSGEGHYDWHADVFAPDQNNFQRKLTGVLLLNDCAEFEGGKLEIKSSNSAWSFEKQGCLIVFPSFLEHRVTPVTSGTRYSATSWAVGPAFR
jgi:PKHD-type hydroxylase